MARRNAAQQELRQLASNRMAWYIFRNYPREESIRRTQEAFPMFSRRSITGVYEQWIETRASRMRYDRSSDTRTLSNLLRGTATGNTNTARVAFRWTFYNQKEERRQSAWLSIDVPTGTTKAELDKMVYEKMKAWMIEKYEYRDRQGRFMGGSIRDFGITNIFGI